MAGSYIHLKPTIITLRKQGKTYSEIREIYRIPKGTLSEWLKNIKISANAKKRLRKKSYERWKKGNEIFIQKRIAEAKKIRDNIKKRAKKEIKNIDLKLIGASLYWGEGSKTHRHHLRFTNSDPNSIKMMMRFFREICLIPNDKIKARFHIYPHIDCKKTLNFWSKITNLPKKSFYPPQTQISKASKGKRPKNRLPYGTLHLIAGNTESACKVKGWIEGIIDKI